MFANDFSRWHRAASWTSLLMILAALAPASQAQTIKEISDLQKAKVLADLKKQLAQANEAAMGSVVAMAPRAPAPAAPAFAAVAPRVVEDEPRAALAVTAIYGVGDALTAAVSDNNSRSVRMAVGERTASGWLVEGITRSGVTFSRVLPPRAAPPAEPSKASGKPNAANARGAASQRGNSNSNSSARPRPEISSASAAPAPAAPPEPRVRRVFISWAPSDSAPVARPMVGLPTQLPAFPGQGLPSYPAPMPFAPIPLSPPAAPARPAGG
jgi:type IV pilus biogenesis protein PilP